VQCEVPYAVGVARAAAREHQPGAESDATADVAARLRSAWEALDEIPPGRHVVLRTDRPVSDAADDLEALLDRVGG
jgi:predicted kinase